MVKDSYKNITISESVKKGIANTITKAYRKAKSGKNNVVVAATVSKPRLQRHSKTVPRTLFPDTKFMKLVYKFNSSLITDTQRYRSGVAMGWNLNSIVQPFFNQIAGDKMPQEFAQLWTHYERFLVHGAKVKIVFQPTGQTERQQVMLGLASSVNRGQSLTNLDADFISSKKGYWLKNLNADKSTVVLNKYFPMHKLEGLTKLQYSVSPKDYQGVMNPSVAALSASNPVKMPSLQIASINNTSTSAVYTDFEITIDYYCQFDRRITTANSTSTA